MNALVASVIRTLVPNIVTQVVSWLLLAHVVLPPALLAELSSAVGFALFAIYYVGVRVLEQQWPSLGILLGLPSSPDTYSKDNAAQSAATAAVPAAPTVNTAPVLTALAPVADTSIPTLPDAGGFQSKIEAAINGTPAPEATAAVTPTVATQADVPAAPAQ